MSTNTPDYSQLIDELEHETKMFINARDRRDQVEQQLIPMTIEIEDARRQWQRTMYAYPSKPCPKCRMIASYTYDKLKAQYRQVKKRYAALNQISHQARSEMKRARISILKLQSKLVKSRSANTFVEKSTQTISYSSLS